MLKRTQLGLVDDIYTRIVYTYAMVNVREPRE